MRHPRVAVPVLHPAVQPPPWTAEIVYAIKAVAAGEANAFQQALVMNYIIKTLSRYGEMSFDPSNDGVTAFREGRRYVGGFIVKMIEMTAAEIKAIKGVPVRDPNDDSPDDK